MVLDQAQPGCILIVMSDEKTERAAAIQMAAQMGNGMAERAQRLLKLRVPFEPHQISKLDRGRGVQLDYVGHAALTHRLLEVDPLWTWEPMALTAEGLPRFDETGGLWIRLTVCGMTRLGYGHAQKKQGPGDREKEVIGDAIRNAAMRFGAALDLWHKGGDLYGSTTEESDEQVEDTSEFVRDAAEQWLSKFDKARTTAEVTDVNNELKAKWDSLRTLPGMTAEAVRSRRDAAYARVKTREPGEEG